MKTRTIMWMAALAMLTACSGGDGRDTIAFETVTVDRTVALSNDDVPPTCSVHLAVQQAKDEAGERGQAINRAVMALLFDREEARVQEAAEAFADEYTASYMKTLLPLYNQDRADTTKRAWYEYHYVVNTSTQTSSHGTVAYLANIDYYEGGAHGLNQTLVMNFDLGTGRQIELADVFAPGYEKPLGRLLAKALMIKEGAVNMGELRAKGYLRQTAMYASKNFVLGDETVTFIYNPYEIAPYANGATELTIAYQAMERLLNPNFKH